VKLGGYVPWWLNFLRPKCQNSKPDAKQTYPAKLKPFYEPKYKFQTDVMLKMDSLLKQLLLIFVPQKLKTP